MEVSNSHILILFFVSLCVMTMVMQPSCMFTSYSRILSSIEIFPHKYEWLSIIRNAYRNLVLRELALTKSEIKNSHLCNCQFSM